MVTFGMLAAPAGFAAVALKGNASVYQVRLDGSRERLWMRPGWADPADWDAFIAHLRRIGALESSG